jgi:Ca2+:H+ antiporter
VPGGLTRREALELAIGAVAVVVAAVAHFAGATPVLAFALAAAAIAFLARLVGSATEQLGGRMGSGPAGAIQSALGNLPELFIALFALAAGLDEVVKAALVGSILANSLLVLGLAFVAGGLRHGVQTFHSRQARMIATLTALAATVLAVPTLAHTFHAPAAAHSRALSLICAGVLLVLFLVTLRGFIAGVPRDESGHEPPRWSMGATVLVLASAGIAAAFVSDWFVQALEPATKALHMSPAFAGLVVVAIAGNAVENVVGVQLAARNRPDFAISVILSSSLQIALALTPLLAIALLMAAGIGALVVYDGESTWQEGAILIGLYVVLAASFWWGA